MNYDFETLYAEAGSEAFSGGKKRFYDNKVSEISFSDLNGKFKISAIVTGNSNYPVSIIFDETGGLYDYKCGCSIFSINSGPCKHIVASALTYEDKYPQKQTNVLSYKDKTDAVALSLAQDFSKRKNRRFKKSEESGVKLIPVLTLKENDRFSLRFLIGRNKMYTLKDISDFVSAVSSVSYRRYGVELEFDHYIENFDEYSKALIKFLIASYNEKLEVGRDTALPLTNYRDELPLIANDVDDFMELMSGKAIQYDNKAVREGYRFIETGVNTADFNISLSETDGGFVITDNLINFNVINGKKYTYIVDDSRIYKVTGDYSAVMVPLLKAISLNKRIYIAKADMPLFYNSVIVQAAKYSGITAGNIDLSVFEAASFNAKLYIDIAADGMLSAKLICSYDDESVDIFNDNEITGMVRDWETESELKKLIYKYFQSAPQLLLKTEAQIYYFMFSGISELFNYADIYLAEEVKKMKIKKPPRIKIGVRLESDLLKVDLEAEEYSEEQLRVIISAYREKKNYIRLNDGSFVDLIDTSIGAVSDILDVTGAMDNDFTLPKYYVPYLDSELKEGFFSLERDASFKKLIKDLASARDTDIAVPAELKDIMRNYQKTGFRWLKTLCKYGFGGILADDMGLGKSLQVIALLKSDMGGTSIIICPTTLILNWVNEFSKFAPDFKIAAVMGSVPERKSKADYYKNYDVLITSFELIRRDEDFYKDIDFNYAVIDEAQYIKNPDTKNSKSAKSLRANHRLALTGTPIENSLAELWSIFDFIMPGYLYSYPRFKEKFETGIVRGDEEAAAKLRKLVNPFILRRLKSSVLKELPSKMEICVESPLEKEQKDLYYSNLSLIKNSVKAAGSGINKIVVLSMLTKLRQICCEPRLIYPEYNGNSAKLDTCMEILCEAVESGHKVLLFSQFTSMLDIIKSKIVENGISYFMLKGDTPKAERMRLVNRFNSNDTKVFLISLKAGGTGLNLTGADVVIHYDPWWNESVMNQATDRAYRLGQDKSVQVYKLTVKNTIEQKILQLQNKKTALSSLIVGGAGNKNFSYSDILEIFEEN